MFRAYNLHATPQAGLQASVVDAYRELKRRDAGGSSSSAATLRSLKTLVQQDAQRKAALALE